MKSLKSQRHSLALLAGLALPALTWQAEAGTHGAPIGAAPPPGAIGGYIVAPFPSDGRPEDSFVNNIAAPLLDGVPRTLTVSQDVRVNQIGSGWATWNPYYAGQVYDTAGSSDPNNVTLIMPADTTAFYCYLAPLAWADINFTATPAGGSSVAQSINGQGQAEGFAFYADPGEYLTTISLHSADWDGFAMGQFGMNVNAIPEPSQVAMSLLTLLGAGSLAVRRWACQRKSHHPRRAEYAPHKKQFPISYMKQHHVIVSIVGLALATTNAFCIEHLTSTNVAVIPNYTGGGYGGGGAGIFNPAWFPNYNFTTIIPPQVSSWQSLRQFDTVIIYQFCNIASYPSFTSNLVAWVANTGGKILIWDSDACANTTTYTWLDALGAKFDRFSPGQTGNTGGSLVIMDNNGLGSSNTNSPYYVNTAVMVAQTDAVGDLNVVNENTVAPVWCAQMRGTNTVGRAGFAHMYTQVGGLFGAPDGMVIYCGLDTDFIAAPGPSGGGQIQKVFALELAHGWGPQGSATVADLTCLAPVGNLSVTPVLATNYVGQPHTVTSTVSLYDFTTGQTVPQSGVTVSFTVNSGPNSGVLGSGVSDGSGHVTFTYVGNSPGTDTILATATVGGLPKVATVQKVWISPCQVLVITSTPVANRGYYTLTASSGCYSSTNLEIYIRDTASAAVVGPISSGTTVRVKRSATTGVGPGVPPASITVTVKGDGVAIAVDPDGRTSAPVTLKPL